MESPELDLKAGEWVKVRTKEEILATLDARSCFEHVPFMPEMLAYCGRSFRVYKRAHKTCDFTNGMQARKLAGSVHLQGIRCTGAAHGNCQAECLVFWKEAWLERTTPPAVSAGSTSHSRSAEGVTAGAAGAPRGKEEVVWKSTKTVEADPGDGQPRYSCQATQIMDFTQPLPLSELGQYVEAYRSRNFSLFGMMPTIIFRIYRRIMNLGIGIGPAMRWLYDAFQSLRGGVPYPSRSGLIQPGEKTPRGQPLDLQPGEWVRVRSHEEILKTVDENGKNRGLIFSQEMVPNCGKTYRVHSRVSRIIDEKTGRMLEFKNDCIILENVFCEARYNECLMYCTRSSLAYWREIWLERVSDPAIVGQPVSGVRQGT